MLFFNTYERVTSSLIWTTLSVQTTQGLFFTIIARSLSRDRPYQPQNLNNNLSLRCSPGFLTSPPPLTMLQWTILSWTAEFLIWVKRGKRCTRRILPCYLICRKHFTCPLIGQRPLHGFSSQKRIRKTQRQIRQIRKSIKKTFTTLINDDEYTLKPLIQRSVRGDGAHKSARYVHQIHDVTFWGKLGLTVFGFFTQHHLVPGPVIVSSNQRAAYCNTIS